MKMPIRILIAAAGVVLVLGAVGTVKGLQIKAMVAQSESFVPPPQTVTVAEVTRMEWETTLTAVGSLEAVQGVTVTAELPGKVVKIAFESGSVVSAGQLLLQQDVSQERAQLRAARSRALLASKELERAEELRGENVIPEATLDDRKASYEQASAEVENVKAIIDKKTIRAPFAGRLGIRQVNLGEVMDTGQAIVMLQSMDPIYVNFQLPQQELGKLRSGLTVRASTDSTDEAPVNGIISAVNPAVDATTRNIRVQATLKNPDERLRPGMFVSVDVVLPARQSVTTIPVTAVFHAPYSDSVFIVEINEKSAEESQPVLRQQFVQLGEKRGDFIAVRNGLEVGQAVVSTGVFKLRNGMPVVVDNTQSPAFELTPSPANS